MGCTPSAYERDDYVSVTYQGRYKRNSFLINAVGSKNLELVAVLLSRSELDLSSEFEVALTEACILPILDIAQLLLNQALRAACCGSYLEVVSLLLSSSWLTQPTREQLNDLISMTCRVGRKDVVELLLEHRAVRRDESSSHLKQQ